jgi:hypothetical protein
VPKQRTSKAHWKVLLGDDFEIGSRWLAPTTQIASAVPGQRRSDPWLRTIEDEAFRFLAIDDEVNHVTEIDRGEVTVFSVDWDRVADSLAKHAGLVRSSVPDTNGAAWHWATALPRMGFAFPIFLGRGPLLDSLVQIRDQTDQPFVLMRLRSKNVDTLCARLLNERHGLLLSLAEVTQPDDQDALAFTQSAQERIRIFQDKFLPKVQPELSKSGFPTPPKCTWPSITIRFLDIDSVSITAAGVTGRYHFSEMGFANGNNKRSNIQWDLLRSFSKGYGVLTWDSPGASRRNQKRKERLSETLCQFFGITDDPIRWMPDRCGWQSLFAVYPER